MASKHQLQESEVQSLQEDWMKKIAADAQYWLENDAKKRAISSAKSYEEFSDIVKAAHLRPISKAELAELSRKRSNYNFSQLKIPVKSSFHSTLANETVPDANCMEQINTPAKFADIWNKLSSTEQLKLLRHTPLTTLDKYFKQELPAALLSDMTKFLSHDTKSDEWLGQLLKIIINSNRFGINRLFLSPEENEFYKTIIEKMSSPDKAVLMQGFRF